MATVDSADLVAPIAADEDTLIATIGGWNRPALLSGGRGFGAAGRWSILAAEPRLEIEATDRTTTFRRDGLVLHRPGDPLDHLAECLTSHGLARLDDDEPADDLPFRGGLIGHFGYDLAPLLEHLPRRADRDSRIADYRFGLYDTAVILDHEAGTARLVAFDLLDEGERAVRKRFQAWRERLAHPQIAVRNSIRQSDLISGFDRRSYGEAVSRSLDYIRAGDIFQVNLSQRFQAFGNWNGLELYRHLRGASPAPYACFLAWDDLALIGSSPELFYETRGEAIRTRPIKGTRPRGRHADEDAAFRRELLTSPKDRAELTMIVDLERNDLGRACAFGSVRVASALTIESFAQVHHLVATVEGRLRSGLGPVDVVRAVFPGGSITGAPKIRAMEIIDELEPTRRSAYTGAVGFFSRGGLSTFNIAIRTMLLEGDRLSYQVGGGIVADSDPDAEYQETLHKGRGLRAVIEGVPRC